MDVWPTLADNEELERPLLGFIGEATEWEDHPESRGEIENAIRQKAAELLRLWERTS